MGFCCIEYCQALDGPRDSFFLHKILDVVFLHISCIAAIPPSLHVFEWIGNGENILYRIGALNM